MKEPKLSAAAAGAGLGTTRPPIFEVASVEKIDAPEGGRGRNWYRYVLKSHCSTITGQRQGSRQFVHDYAIRCAEQLNARAASCQSIWNPRGRKPAAGTR